MTYPHNLLFFKIEARGRAAKKVEKEESSDSHDENKSETSATENEEQVKNNDETKSETDAAEANSHDEKEEPANNNAEAEKVSDCVIALS